MKILIVSAWYSPAIHPRAHRWATIAAYWASRGHQVTVLTSQHAGGMAGESLEHHVRVIRTGHSALHEALLHCLGLRPAKGKPGEKSRLPNRLTRLFAWFYQYFWTYWIFPDDAAVWFIPAKRKLYQLMDTEQFDLLITVSMPFTGHCLGLSAKRHFHARMPCWIADIGDPFAYPSPDKGHAPWRNRLNRKWEHRLLQSADGIAVTTAALQKHYLNTFENLDAEKFRVISPIFVPNNHEKTTKVIDSQGIKIGYFGNLYYPVRPPDAFVAFANALQQHCPDLFKKLEFHFYGDLNPEVQSKISQIPQVFYHGLCSREDAAARMQSMHLLLNIGNQSSIQLPSKCVDYLASGKPVLHLSLTDNDPFVTFFQTYPAFFSCPVIQKKIDTDLILTLASWIQTPQAIVAQEHVLHLLAPHRIESVAHAYLDWYHNC